MHWTFFKTFSYNQFLQKAELGWRHDIDQREASQSGDVNFIDPAEDFLGEEELMISLYAATCSSPCDILSGQSFK